MTPQIYYHNNYGLIIGVLSTLAKRYLGDKLRHQYDVIPVTVTYLSRRWYRSMAEMYAMLRQIFSDITN